MRAAPLLLCALLALPSLAEARARASQPAFANAGKTSLRTNRPMTKAVRGYVKRSGGYVQPYAKSQPRP